MPVGNRPHFGMKSSGRSADKELYRHLRAVPCERRWDEEVARFDRATTEERTERVALVRAVGVVFSETGTPEQRAIARVWLRGLLHDPLEKIRRYAIAALPKIGTGSNEETELLSLLRTTTVEREKKFLGRALEKVGEVATLEQMKGAGGLHLQTEQKVRASLARAQMPSAVRMDRLLSDFTGLRIHLRGRRGLEQIVRDEVEAFIRKYGKFRIAEVHNGLIAITPVAPFSLADIYKFRCFGTVGLMVGTNVPDGAQSIDALASVITSPLSRRVLERFTEGPTRYRLDFISKGHQRGAVRLLANRVYARCPEILNSAQEAPWTIAIHSTGRGNSVELSPRLTPDPRFYYRQDDVPAASHPPLAACMARLAGKMDNEVVWDPFCGSGLELIERALLGGVRRIYGTDRSPEALAITEKNFAAAKVPSTESKFVCCDFRDFASVEGLGPNAATLIVTNPPMGKRVHIANVGQLIADLFAVASTVLRPDGRLVFANPLRMESPEPSLKLQSRRVVDLGGFDCRLEVYLKVAGSRRRS